MLPELSSYSNQDLEKAKQLSPAVLRYLNILNDLQNDDIFKLRHSAWVECALATLLDKADAAAVCRHWSDVADKIIMRCWREAELKSDDVALFALGKLGAQELNLSSDIDVTIITAASPTADVLKKVRKLVMLLSGHSASGFCFRVDLDLRPGGKYSPMACSVTQFQDYYWSLGETWERLALVRLRPICGTESVIREVVEIAQKFSFRRHLDFGLLEDLKKLRSQIHHFYPQDNHAADLKLMPGGIRDIELFIHALQVIHGGKFSDLRTWSTTKATASLKNNALFRENDLSMLLETYWQLRTLENKVQAVADEHTHILEAPSLWQRDFDALKSNISSVDHTVSEVLGKPSSAETFPEDPEEQKKILMSYGFKEKTVDEVWPRLISLTALSTRTFEDEQVRRRLLRQFTEYAAKNSIDPDLGLSLFADFIKNIRAKTSFFYMLQQHPKLIEDLGTIFGCSPLLGGIVSSRPELLDSYLFRVTAESAKDTESYLESLVERRLLVELIAASIFLKNLDLDALSDSFTLAADDITTELLNYVGKEIPSKPISLLALGKWGSQGLGVQSDLDFIFLLEDLPEQTEQKVGRRFLTRLSETHRGGPIYKIDLRLRPSGKAGPLMLARPALIEYLTETADPWERQTYLRARLVGDASSPVTTEVHNACISRGLSESELGELKKIQTDLFRAQEGQDLKYSPGGILDIELAVQTHALSARKLNATQGGEWSKLRGVLKELRVVEQCLHLVQEHGGSRVEPASPAIWRLARLLKVTPQTLLDRIQGHLESSTSLLKNLDPRRQTF